MKIKNLMSDEDKEILKDFKAIKKALIKKNILTASEIEKEK